MGSRGQLDGLRCIVSDDTGLVKQVTFNQDRTECKIQRFCEQDKARVPQVLSFVNEQEVLLALSNGTVERLNLENGETSLISSHGESEFVGMFQTDGTLTTCEKNGKVKCVRSNKVEVEFQAAPHVNKMRVCEEKMQLLAVGGEDSELRIWDLESQDKPAFKAKNVKPDKLQLQAPRNIKDLSFLPESGGTKLATGTAYREIRIYDTAAQARPVLNEVVSEFAVNAIAVAPSRQDIVFGDVAGGVYIFDIRAGRIKGKLKGMTGSCRSVQYHPTLNYIFTCGLDRHVRVYNEETRQCVQKLYLKQRLGPMLVASDLGPGKDALKGNAEQPAEEDVWDELDKTVEKKRKSKRAKVN
eukprot:m.23361 g.23361  ORF g.23361 m.23361 type:complete len:355 (+) comp7493_c0_seq2:118-1182(+)